LDPKHQAIGIEALGGVGDGPIIGAQLDAALLNQAAAHASGAKTLRKKNVLQGRHGADIVARFVAMPIYR
jgi:hypothetical protein